jgi:PAS domain-containing protein
MQHISDFSARELIAQAEEHLRVLHRAYSLFASNFPSSSSSSSSSSPFSLLVDFPVPGDYNAPALESPAIRMDLQFLSSTSAWHSLSSLAGAGILIWSGDGMCLYASPLVCQWTGVGASLLSSRVAAVMEHVPQGNVELFYRRYYALAADPRVLMYRSVSVVYKSGPGWICSTALFLRDALGRPKYTVCLQVPVDHLWPAELGRGEDVIYLTSSAASGDRL